LHLLQNRSRTVECGQTCPAASTWLSHSAHGVVLLQITDGALAIVELAKTPPHARPGLNILLQSAQDVPIEGSSNFTKTWAL
jgi:hypothetical protein